MRSPQGVVLRDDMRVVNSRLLISGMTLEERFLVEPSLSYAEVFEMARIIKRLDVSAF